MKFMPQRQRAIRELLSAEHQLQIPELARRFAVSTMTIRRDLAALEAEGILLRTFGGGVAVPAATAQSFPIAHCGSLVKQAIGLCAAGLVQPGQTVIVDAGTTTLEVVRHLPREAEVTLVTNSLSAAQEMLGTGMRVLLLGGYLSTDEVRIFGPLTEACLANLHADLLFVGCVGASATHGFYMSDLYLTSNVQAMVRAANGWWWSPKVENFSSARSPVTPLRAKSPCWSPTTGSPRRSGDNWRSRGWKCSQWRCRTLNRHT